MVWMIHTCMRLSAGKDHTDLLCSAESTLIKGPIARGIGKVDRWNECNEMLGKLDCNASMV